MTLFRPEIRAERHAVADNKLEVDIALKKFRRRISDEVKKEEKNSSKANMFMHRPFVF